MVWLVDADQGQRGDETEDSRAGNLGALVQLPRFLSDLEPSCHSTRPPDRDSSNAEGSAGKFDFEVLVACGILTVEHGSSPSYEPTIRLTLLRANEPSHPRFMH